MPLARRALELQLAAAPASLAASTAAGSPRPAPQLPRSCPVPARARARARSSRARRRAPPPGLHVLVALAHVPAHQGRRHGQRVHAQVGLCPLGRKRHRVVRLDLQLPGARGAPTQRRSPPCCAASASLPPRAAVLRRRAAASHAGGSWGADRTAAAPGTPAASQQNVECENDPHRLTLNRRVAPSRASSCAMAGLCATPSAAARRPSSSSMTAAAARARSRAASGA